jgi:hypothetical protein
MIFGTENTLAVGERRKNLAFGNTGVWTAAVPEDDLITDKALSAIE